MKQEKKLHELAHRELYDRTAMCVQVLLMRHFLPSDMHLGGCEQAPKSVPNDMVGFTYRHGTIRGDDNK